MKFSNLATFPPRSGWLEMEDEDDYHVYEDIDLPPSATKLPQKSTKMTKFEMSPKPAKLLTAFRRSCSDSELFQVSSLHERHEIEVSKPCNDVTPFLRPSDDVTFYHREPEQGFYKCHDNIEDIHERDLIPDLAPKLLREKRHLLKEMSKELDVFFDEKTSTNCRRRLSLDSGRGGSVVAEEEDLVDEASKLEEATATIAFTTTTTTTTSAVSSTTSLPSRSSSMSSGIGSMHSSYSTLQQQQTWSQTNETTTKHENNEKEFFLSSENDETSLLSSSSSLTFTSSNPSRPTYETMSTKNDEEKSFDLRSTNSSASHRASARAASWVMCGPQVPTKKQQT